MFISYQESTVVALEQIGLFSMKKIGQILQLFRAGGPRQPSPDERFSDPALGFEPLDRNRYSERLPGANWADRHSSFLYGTARGLTDFAAHPVGRAQQ